MNLKAFKQACEIGGFNPYPDMPWVSKRLRTFAHWWTWEACRLKKPDWALYAIKPANKRHKEIKKTRQYRKLGAISE